MTELDAVNRRGWDSRSVTEDYGTRTSVWQVERVIFDRYREHLTGKRILDMGCGTGRTTAELLKFSADYVGIDYSPGMIARFARRFPRVRVQRADMRDLSGFADGAFDFVLCSFNGLDYMPHAGRLQALAEVRRVLAGTGLFVFSAHNRAFPGVAEAPRVPWSRRPLATLRALGGYLLDARNRRRLGHLQVFTPEYAILNDCAHHYSLLTYYIGRAQQTEQLRQAGFELLEAYDRGAARIEPDGPDRHSSFIYYVARKAASEAAGGTQPCR
jgi:SAM-dependent methyltransferase